MKYHGQLVEYTQRILLEIDLRIPLYFFVLFSNIGESIDCALEEVVEYSRPHHPIYFSTTRYLFVGKKFRQPVYIGEISV